ncbi:hypothetical protein CATMIT_01712, partial [Catenibacterium mitsuokai DSM 15897]
MLDHFQAAEYIAFGVGQGLALFGAEDRRQLAHVLADELLVLEEDPRARADRGLAPGLERARRGGDGGVDFRGRGHRHARQHGLGGGIDHLAPMRGARFDELAVDEQLDGRDIGRDAVHFVHVGLRIAHPRSADAAETRRQGETRAHARRTASARQVARRNARGEQRV